MGLFTRSPRPHLRMVDDIPRTVEPTPQTHGEVIGAKVDAMVKARAHVVACQGDLHRAEIAAQEAELAVIEAIDKLNMSEGAISRYAKQRTEG